MAKSTIEKDILLVRCPNPHDYLGMHKTPKGVVVRAYLKDAASCEVVDVNDDMASRYKMKLIDPSGLYEAEIPGRDIFAYRLRTVSYAGEVRQFYDPYSFLPSLSEEDLYLIGKGDDHRIFDKLGSHIKTCGGIRGTAFAVWAPTARRVSLVGDFNEWDGRYHQMRALGSSGIWEIFVPSITAGVKYKYEILPANSDTPFLKTDPYAMRFEPSPYNASIVCDISSFKWGDAEWIGARAKADWKKRPISVYEVHLGSWKRKVEDGGRPFRYSEIGPELAAYCKKMGFTHVEFLPLSEYPFDGSWGYQVTGFYAPTQRYGTPLEFMRMIDDLHREGIGVIMDWVPAHFPRDFFALAKFDGTCLYEHQDPRQGEQKDWGTLVFNYGRNEVKNFLTGSALAWFERFHIDGLRVDAVASMLYLDFSRREGEWIPNKFGGKENLEAIEFLRSTNSLVKKYFPGSIMIAEESTAFAGVTKPVEEGGLGFDFKWNMGWMHDTLAYMREDPINRKYHHGQLTFPAMYQFSENFVSVYSHDEVVHGKSSMVNKMGGAYWGDKIANLRALYAYMWMWPGKKTLFMGSEFGQSHEWKYDSSLDWHFLEYPEHAGIQRVVSDAANLYLKDAALAEGDLDATKFSWINCHDGNNSVISFLRYAGKKVYAVVCNFTPVMRSGYRIGLPIKGEWREALNTDATIYCGNGDGNCGKVQASQIPCDGYEFSAELTLPAMSTLVLVASRE
ncbi:MAG: 1,4-alpha-glucan branching protein GlgB [Opitutales bacterium]|nr:1,4-alpha-glucan branching protein GlgB [Opitutales bacterium]